MPRGGEAPSTQEESAPNPPIDFNPPSMSPSVPAGSARETSPKRAPTTSPRAKNRKRPLAPAGGFEGRGDGEGGESGGGGDEDGDQGWSLAGEPIAPRSHQAHCSQISQCPLLRDLTTQLTTQFFKTHHAHFSPSLRRRRRQEARCL